MKKQKKVEKLDPLRAYARDVRRAKIKTGLCVAGAFAAGAALLWLCAESLKSGIGAEKPQTAEITVNPTFGEAEVVEFGHSPNSVALGVMDYAEFYGAAELPAEGVGRCNAMQYTACDTQGTRAITADVLDYTSGVIWGWDGRYCELWEMDLFAKIFYLEFWGSSETCCEAGCDAILRLWESGEFGDSLGGVLSAINAAGDFVYSTYPAVWTTKYDLDGLAWCREYCLKRFTSGPVWIATYFQKYGYPHWREGSPIPCYEIDGVYFSVAVAGWQ